MKFYVIEIAEGDAKIAGKAIYEYESLNAAEASYHQRLATAMKSDLYTSDLVLVTNSNGDYYNSLRRKYVKETAEE